VCLTNRLVGLTFSYLPYVKVEEVLASF